MSDFHREKNAWRAGKSQPTFPNHCLPTVRSFCLLAAIFFALALVFGYVFRPSDSVFILENQLLIITFLGLYNLLSLRVNRLGSPVYPSPECSKYMGMFLIWWILYFGIVGMVTFYISPRSFPVQHNKMLFMFFGGVKLYYDQIAKLD